MRGHHLCLIIEWLSGDVQGSWFSHKKYNRLALLTFGSQIHITLLNLRKCLEPMD
jgi:hypothetical protein